MIRNILVLLAIVCLAAQYSLADTVFVDTIGTGSQYQIGRDLARTVQLGFDSHPMSEDFTGVRPAFVAGTTTSYPSGDVTRNAVTERGTTGVPCATLWQQSGTTVQPVSGNFASWVVQPFTPAQSGYVTTVKFIAQMRQSAGYAQGTGRSAYLDIIPAPAGNTLPSDLWTSGSPVSVSLASANLGLLITASGVSKHVTAGQTYWLVLAPVDQKGSWQSGGLDYANLNWSWRSICPDNAKVADALYSNNNGDGDFLPMSGKALGITLSGTVQEPTAMTMDDAKQAVDGTFLKLTGSAISAKTGAVGPNFFYVENTDRSSGIRVVGSTEYSVGANVDVVGTMTTVGVERAIILSDDVTPLGGSTSIYPFGMSNFAVGGETNGLALGADGCNGLNNVGMLVRVWGEVISSTGNEFVITDGGMPGGITCRGTSSMTIPTSGRYSVTGVVTLEVVDGVRKPVILICDGNDILPL